MKKFAIILILTTALMLSGCGEEEVEPVFGTTVQPDIPDSPPGFLLPVDLGKLVVDDYTSAVAEAFVDKTVKYSAIWTVEKKYPTPWADMSNEERAGFELLRSAVEKAMIDGANLADGTLFIQEGIEAGAMFGDWSEKHPENPIVTVWQVSYSSGTAVIDMNPFINVYIAHTEIE